MYPLLFLLTLLNHHTNLIHLIHTTLTLSTPLYTIYTIHHHHTIHHHPCGSVRNLRGPIARGTRSCCGTPWRLCGYTPRPEARDANSTKKQASKHTSHEEWLCDLFNIYVLSCVFFWLRLLRSSCDDVIYPFSIFCPFSITHPLLPHSLLPHSLTPTSHPLSIISSSITGKQYLLFGYRVAWWGFTGYCEEIRRRWQVDYTTLQLPHYTTPKSSIITFYQPTLSPPPHQHTHELSTHYTPTPHRFNSS